ncbi:Mitochondrial import inner membrane translocase subunit Tim21 [Eumeta japonica]|uniref:Mitochondrial import inner membrane translocase subunit Tim21 n=1 Tax=Eumeta variegata TaxID=151549 RepID=A0A4C1VLI2_EUMVA|nr:Mitochondrial import inner membrane translocase subunit Tim21 [Eumeta japonica]
MTIVSKLIPVVRNGSKSDLIPIILQASKIKYRLLSTKHKDSTLAKSSENAEISTDVKPLGEKIKEATKTASYGGDPRVEDALGAPIKGYGEETTRRRRTHVSHAVYEKDGIKHMRMRFYIKGIRNKGIVELDMKQNAYGNYECRYLIVQLDDYSGRTFVIEDNRNELDQIKDANKLPSLNLSI